MNTKFKRNSFNISHIVILLLICSMPASVDAAWPPSLAEWHPLNQLISFLRGFECPPDDTVADGGDQQGDGEGIAGGDVGDPVNIARRVIYRIENDFSIPVGNGLSLSLTRYYSSNSAHVAQSSAETTFGPNWHCIYDSRLDIPVFSETQTDLKFYDETGNIHLLEYTGVEDFPTPGEPGDRWDSMDLQGEQIVAYWADTDEIVLRRENNSGWHFDDDGRLLSIDKNDINSLTTEETLTITYVTSATTHHVEKVTAPNGRYLLFSYDDTYHPLQVTEIEYYDGSSLNPVHFYSYLSGYGDRLQYAREHSSTFGSKIGYRYGSFNGTSVTNADAPLCMVSRWDDTTETPLVGYKNVDVSGRYEPRELWVYDITSSSWKKQLEINYSAFTTYSWIEFFDGANSPETHFTFDGRGDSLSIGYIDLPANQYRAQVFTDSDTETGDDARRIITQTKLYVANSDPPEYKIVNEFDYVIPANVDPFYSNRIETITKHRTSVDAGYETSFEYHDVIGNLVDKIIDTENNETLIEYYDFTGGDPTHLIGLIKEVEDPLGLTTAFAYDSSARISQITYPNGQTLNYTYNGDGFVIDIERKNSTTVLSSVEITYNNWGLPKTVENHLGHTIENYYTISGDFTGMETTEHYPPRIYKKEDNESRIVRYEYDDRGNVTSFTNALSEVTEYEYDARSRVVEVTDPENQTKTYVWDWLDRLVEYHDGEGHQTFYTWDVFGRLFEKTDDEDNTVLYTYTPDSECGACGAGANLPAAIMDPLGNVTIYEYNLQGMMTAKMLLLSPYDPEYDLYDWADFAYDDLGNLEQIVDHRLEYDSVDIGDQTTTIDHDVYGRTTSITYPTGRTEYFEYDALSRTSRTKGPFGHVANMSYDAYSRLDEIADSYGGTIDLTYISNPDHRLSDITMPNGMKSIFTYDTLGRLDKLEYKDDTTALIEKFDLTYNDANMITRVDNVSNNYSTYQYDDSFRMIEEKRYENSVLEREIDYTFDDTGNRTQRVVDNGFLETITNYDHNDLNQVTDQWGEEVGYNDPNYTYDDAGNLTIIKHGTTTVWTATYRPGDDRMTSVTTGGHTTDFVYDVFGRRVMRVDDDGTRTFFYYSGYDVIGEEILPYDVAAKQDEVVLIADDESGANPTDNGWGLYSGSSGTLAYTTDSDRGKVFHWSRTEGSVMLGDRYGSWANAYDAPWAKDFHNLSFWYKNPESPSVGFTVFVKTTSDNEAHMQYWMHNGTNHKDSGGPYYYFDLGNDWEEADNWNLVQLDLEADLKTLAPTEDILEVRGIRFFVEEIYLDDVVLSPGLRTVTRHCGGEWVPPGTFTSTTSGKPTEMELVTYNFFDHLGNLAGVTNVDSTVVGTWDYDTFGNVHGMTGTATASTYQHTRNHFDSDVGLFYFNKRWYDADQGRFTQRHTPFQPLAEHPYAISEGSPSTWFDRSGYSPDDKDEPGILGRMMDILCEGGKKALALPMSVLGVGHGVAGSVLQAITGPFDGIWPSVSIENNALVFHNNFLMRPEFAITLGNVISYHHLADPSHRAPRHDNSRKDVDLGLHEEGHTKQYEVLGVLYIPVYAIAEIATYTPWVKHNFLEVWADDYAEEKENTP